jgi:O-antigen/teichoic acid export membrane protein
MFQQSSEQTWKGLKAMEKALQIGKTSATGSFRLLIGVAASTIIMAVGTLILGGLLTSDELGLYAIVLVPSTLINLFRDWGINSAMTKYIANFRVSNREEEMHDFILAGLIFEVASGVALSFLSLFLASFIATTVFNRPESASYLAIMSVSIISGSLLVASQAGFVGFERMGLNSLTLICQSIAKTATSPLLVILGYRVLGAVIGNVLSFIAAGTIGLASFYLILLRPLRKKRTRKSNMKKTLKTMLKYGVPLSIGTILTGVLAQIYSFIVIPLTSNAIYGNYAVTVYFSVLLTFLTVPISTVLFPAFAKLDGQSERELVRTIFASSVKYASILLVPATMAMMVLSGPIIGTLYGGKYVYGPFFLTLYVVGNLFVVFGNLSSVGLLSGLGETTILMIQSIITLIVGLPLGVVLIQLFGITGLIVASVVSGVPSMFWGLYWIWKHYKAKADFASSAKILAASTIAAVLAYLPTVFLSTANWTKLIIGLIIFLGTYIFGAPLIGAVSLSDINNLRTMFSSMGTVSKIMNIPLEAAEKAARIKSTHRKAG